MKRFITALAIASVLQVAAIGIMAGYLSGHVTAQAQHYQQMAEQNSASKLSAARLSIRAENEATRNEDRDEMKRYVDHQISLQLARLGIQPVLPKTTN